MTAVSETRSAAPAPALDRPRFNINWNWLGVLPFFFFVVMFIVLPSLTLFTGSLFDQDGQFTLDNIRGLATPYILNAYRVSLELSLFTAVLGGTIGFLLAAALTLGGLPRGIRVALMTYCGLAANFGGVPLAFSFIATIGRTGFITALISSVLGIDLYRQGFTLYGFAGLSLTYLYFQLPLTILIIAPALANMKREWREASANLGATAWQYWRHIGLPILLPSLLGTMILLFGNAFGAYATAQALTGGTINLVTIVVGAQIRGDVLGNPGLGYALVLGMVVIMALSIGLYSILQRRTEKWLR
jgi:putative spermidine/putrescine transport system permease protein